MKHLKDWMAVACIVLALGGVVVPAQFVPVEVLGGGAHAQPAPPNSGLDSGGDEDWSGKGCSMTYWGCDADGDEQLRRL